MSVKVFTISIVLIVLMDNVVAHAKKQQSSLPNIEDMIRGDPDLSEVGAKIL